MKLMEEGRNQTTGLKLPDDCELMLVLPRGETLDGAIFARNPGEVAQIKDSLKGWQVVNSAFSKLDLEVLAIVALRGR